MATTKIWAIKKRLDHVINYITNEEKTTKNNSEVYYDLHNFNDYKNLDFINEENLFVTSLNCSSKIAYEEMMITKRQFNKKDGILGYHAFQSFNQGEVTPEVAHEIGIKLAEEIWGDRFEVIISTHINTNHIHNHFVVNSVSFKDGKKYYDNRETYAELRKISDSLCLEYGLSVLKEKPCRKSKINYDNHFLKNMNRNSYYVVAKKNIDKAIAMAYSYKDFENILKAMGYEIIYRANKLSIRRNPYKKNIRIERFFGPDYSIDKITERIDLEQSPRVPFLEEFGLKKYYPRNYSVDKTKKHGLFGLYLHYCYLLGVFPHKNSYHKLTPEMKLDIEKMGQFADEIKWLVKNKINTNEQLIFCVYNQDEELATLKDQRKKLWYKYNTSYNEEQKQEILVEINNLRNSINTLTKEVKISHGIEQRIPTMEKNIDDFNKEGVEINEHIK